MDLGITIFFRGLQVYCTPNLMDGYRAALYMLHCGCKKHTQVLSNTAYKYSSKYEK